MRELNGFTKAEHEEKKVYCRHCGWLLLILMPRGFDTTGPLYVSVARGDNILVSCPKCHHYTKHSLKGEKDANLEIP